MLRFLVAAAAALVTLPAFGGTRYTLEQVLARVAEQHPPVLAAREVEKGADALLDEQRRRWLPNGDLNLSLSSTPEIRCVAGTNCYQSTVVDLLRSAPGVDWWQRGPIGGIRGVVSVGLIQTLYTSGKIETALMLGETNRISKTDLLAWDRAEVMLAAVRAYYFRKSARAQAAAMADGIESIDGWLERIEAQLSGRNVGHYNESDAIRLKIQLVWLRQSLLDQRRWAAAHLQTLRDLLGDQEADVDDEDIAMLRSPERTLDDWQSSALRHRPEARLIALDVVGQRGWRRLRLTEMLPDIGLLSSAIYSYAPAVDPPSIAGSQSLNFAGGSFALGMREYLDLGVKLGRLSQINAELRMKEARRQQYLGWISIDVTKSWLDLREARARVEQLSRAEKIARGWLVSVDANMAAGIYTSGLEMIEVIQSWMGFRQRHISAIADASIALAVLQRATGEQIGPVQ